MPDLRALDSLLCLVAVVAALLRDVLESLLVAETGLFLLVLATEFLCLSDGLQAHNPS